MWDYEFVLPFPPTNNHYRMPCRNRLITSEKGREYKKAVICCMNDQGLHDEMIEDHLSISIEMCAPTKAKRDLDNYLKAMLDGISECGFWVDDSQIDKLTIERGPIVKGGEMRVKVCVR